ncbi:hypothetical protein [Hahella sp. KA22]|uniref:hypothetical protein n=1 Tax=Hahella sp. KA22 TaxID=1628392 RepID=UPI0013E3C528|nr:hypothetical protein [Hahella sp. KA22]
MQWLIHGMEAILFGLIVCLIYSLTEAMKKDANEHVVLGNLSVNSVRKDPRCSCAPSESIKQLQMFWSTQVLEMRLNGFAPDILLHPALFEHTLDYLQGAADATAEFFQCSDRQRLQMQCYLIAKGLGAPGHDDSDLKLIERAQSHRHTEMYVAGHCAAEQWLYSQEFPKECSLFNSINAWGLVA